MISDSLLEHSSRLDQQHEAWVVPEVESLQRGKTRLLVKLIVNWQSYGKKKRVPFLFEHQAETLAISVPTASTVQLMSSRHVTPKGQTRDPIIFEAPYLHDVIAHVTIRLPGVDFLWVVHSDHASI